MPDTNEQHLTYFRKAEIHDDFVSEYRLLYGDNRLPVYNYFIDVWDGCCPKIEVRKIRRFVKCAFCEQI